MTADETLQRDVALAVRDFKAGLESIGTLSDHEKRRVSEYAQHLVADVGKATRDHVRATLHEASVI